jgi:hypothetical protein
MIFPQAHWPPKPLKNLMLLMKKYNLDAKDPRVDFRGSMK